MTRSKKINKKIICSCCGKEKDEKDYHKSDSPFNKFTGKVCVCKDCFYDYVGDDVNKLKEALRMIDKPFLYDLYKSSLEEAEKTGRKAVGAYMKNIVMPQYAGWTWDDSKFEGHEKSKIIANENIYATIVNNEIDNLSEEEIKYLKSFWGKGYSLEDLIWLQSEYEDWINRYECDSKSMETLIQEICKQKLDINKRRDKGEKVDAQLKTLQELLGSSNLKPVQETGANAIEQESFGTLIKKFEKEKPIPEPDPAWKDVDNIGKYIRTFFFGHMARALGIENKFKDEYEEEINKYTVFQEELEDDENDKLL